MNYAKDSERYVTEGTDQETPEQQAERHLRNLRYAKKSRGKHSPEWERLKEEKLAARKKHPLKEKREKGEQAKL